MEMGQVIFDISGQSFQWWPIQLALLFVGVSVVVVLAPRASSRSRISGSTGAIFGIAACAYFAFQFLHFEGLKRDLANHQFETVAGRVQNFHLAAGGSHGPDVFNVSGVRFELWPSPFAQRGFDQDISGKCVEVRFTRGRELLWMALSANCE